MSVAECGRSAVHALSREGMYDVAAIIVNYNGAAFLPRCLDALRSAVGSLSMQTVIVDNSSDDGSVDHLDPSIDLIRLERNYGFSHAVNVGTQHAHARYFLLLNTDCFIRPGMLDRLVARLDADPSLAAVGPQLLNLDGTLQPSCHDDPQPLVLFLEQSGLWRLLRRLPMSYEWLAVAGSHQRHRQVDWIVGACLLIRREALCAVGGLDERYFFYWEEADLCRRLRRCGWRILFEPNAQAVHIGGGSSHTRDLVLQFYTSLYRYYGQHYSRRRLICAHAVVRSIALWKALRAGVATLLPRPSLWAQHALSMWPDPALVGLDLHFDNVSQAEAFGMLPPLPYRTSSWHHAQEVRLWLAVAQL